MILVKTTILGAHTDSISQLPYHSFEILKDFDKVTEHIVTHLLQDSLFAGSDSDYRRFSRNFNIDLQPKVLYSKSVSVNELIRSGVSNYLEFQNVSENFFYTEENNGAFVKIPFSKSEVFANTFLTFFEKRQLVKVIDACLAGYDKMSEAEVTQSKINSTHTYEKEIEMSRDEQRRLIEARDKPIRQFLEKEMGIEKRMQDILLYAIGNVNENQFAKEEGEQLEVEKITTFQFFERIQKYLRSIGYYGDSPFLLCTYGSSEYAQAFSRIGSLHSNVYIVNEDLKIKDIEFESTDGKHIFKTASISFSKPKLVINLFQMIILLRQIRA